MQPHDAFRSLAVAAFLACYVTLLLGGNVMASDSGLACPDWPTCHGSVVPRLAGATAIEFSHRASALALTLLVAAVFVAAVLAERRRPVLLRLAAVSLGTVVGQALVGWAVVASDLSAGVVLLHLALATVLFVLLLLLALLANLRELPVRWRAWARRATEEAPTRDASAGGVRNPSWTPGSPDAVAHALSVGSSHE